MTSNQMYALYHPTTDESLIMQRLDALPPNQRGGRSRLRKRLERHLRRGTLLDAALDDYQALELVATTWPAYDEDDPLLTRIDEELDDEDLA